MKPLHLVLNKQWYEEIASGRKPEEYRELSNYWIHRLCFSRIQGDCTNPRKGKEGVCAYCHAEHHQDWCAYPFDCVTFQLGYAKNAPRMTFEVKEICIGHGKVIWGRPKGINPHFIIRLGDRIDGNLLITDSDLEKLGCGECDGSAFVCNNGKSVLDNAIIVWNKGKCNDNCGCFECFKKLKRR